MRASIGTLSASASLAVLALAVLGLPAAHAKLPAAPRWPDWQQTFDPSVDRKHNFCPQAEAALEVLRRDPSDRTALRSALRGENISSAWPPPADYEPPGLLTGTEDGTVLDEGAMVKIFNELAARAGFHWRDFYGIVEIPDGEDHENKSWNELLMWSSEVYDISVDW